MNVATLRCPSCAVALPERDRGSFACSNGHKFSSSHGIADLRVHPGEPNSWPIGRERLERALERLARGTPYKEVLEELLLDLDEPSADRSMQLLRESRGAWIPLLAERGGRALLVGNALSG